MVDVQNNLQTKIDECYKFESMRPKMYWSAYVHGLSMHSTSLDSRNRTEHQHREKEEQSWRNYSGEKRGREFQTEIWRKKKRYLSRSVALSLSFICNKTILVSPLWKAWAMSNQMDPRACRANLGRDTLIQSKGFRTYLSITGTHPHEGSDVTHDRARSR